MPKYQLPPLNSLRPFEAAARLKSIKAAADELHVTQGSVSRHIHKLELQLGRQLFQRYHKRIRLTDAGEMMLAEVGMGFAHIERAYLQLRANHLPDRLVISVDPDFAALWLVPRYWEFYARVSDILVEIESGKSPLLVQDLRISCAIQYAKAGIQGKNIEVLFRSRLFPVCSPGLMRATPIRTVDDLRRHKLLHDRTMDEWQDYVRSEAPSTDINVYSGTLLNNTTLCLDAAVRGYGVAIGDDYLAAQYLAEGRLVEPFTSEVLSENEYYFVRPDHTAAHPMVDAFREWLMDGIKRTRSRD